MTKKGHVRRRATLMAATAVLAMIPVTAQAQRSHQAHFDIAEQDLGTALTDLARQSGREIYFSADLTRGKRAPRLKGTLSVERALDRLLSNSGLRYRMNGTGGIVVEAQAVASAGVVATATAQADADEEDQRGIADILVVGSRSQNTDIRRTHDDAQPYQVFTQKDIQSSQATTLEDFFRTRVPSNTTQGSVGQRSSVNNGFTGTPGIANGVGSTRSSINLRGFGSNQTLILVDGRRLSDLSIQDQGTINGSSVLTGSGQPDINGIPLASIERIEILSSTAGGIYGGNAVGGVINIILRHDYRGLEVTANYQDTADLKYPIGRLDIVGGLALDSKTNITFSGSISRTGTQLYSDRTLPQDAELQAMSNNPAAFTSTAARAVLPPVSLAVNYVQAGRTPLTLKDAYGGGTLGNYFGTVPIGFTGSQLDLGNALKANAGRYNIQEPLGNNGKARTLLSAPELQSFNVNLRRNVFSWLDVFADYSRFENDGAASASVGGPANVTLAGTSKANPNGAPTNPFNESVIVVFDSPVFATPFLSKSVTQRLTLGGTLRLPHHWAAGFDYTWNRENSTQSYTQLPIDVVGNGCALRQGILPNSAACSLQQGVNGANSPTDTRPVINPFVNPDFTPYLLTTPTNTGSFSNSLRTVSFRLSGPVFELPAGAVNFSGSLKRDIARTNLGYSFNQQLVNNTDTNTGSATYNAFPPAEQSTTSEYGEVRIPLFSPRNATTLLQVLELQLSVRHDAYRTEAYVTSLGQSSGTLPAGTPSFAKAIANFGTATQVVKNQSTNFTIAGKYSPFKPLTFRASYGTGFTEPTVNQVVTFTDVFSFFVSDPLRGDTYQDNTQPYTVLEGGSGLNFKAETSKSYSFGAILENKLGSGDLRLSADYTRIDKRNEITSASAFNIINSPELYPASRLQRAPLTASDIALGYTGGLITFIDTTSINQFKSFSQSYDFQADYTFKAKHAGEFRLYAFATYQPNFQRQVYVDQPNYDFAGFADGPLKWHGNGGIDWTDGPLSIQYNIQFYSRYKVTVAADDSLNADRIRTQGSDHIPAQAYSDIYVSYAFPTSSGVLKGVRVSGGIQNFLNTSPPIVADKSYVGAGYSGYGDPRLRRFTLTLKKAIGN